MPRVSIVAAFPVVLAAIALTLLTGCASPPTGPGPAGPATALTLPARSSSSATDDGASTATAPPADGDDVAACFDGDCEVRVTDGTTIPLDPRFEVESVTVTVKDGRGRITINTATGTSSAGGVGSTTIHDDLAVKLLAVEGDTATIRVSSG